MKKSTVQPAQARAAKPGRLLALFMSVALSMGLMMALVACGGNDAAEPETNANSGTESSGTANMPNPVVEVDSIEEINEQLGVNLAVPADATIKSCSITDDTLGEVVFTYENTTYTFRAQNGQKLEDISGLYYDFEAEHEFDTAGITCKMQYNEGGPGYCHWYDEVGKVTYSVSVDTGASQQGLTDIAELLNAEQILM